MRRTTRTLLTAVAVGVLLVAGTPAIAAPTSRGFGPAIDAYAGSEPPSTCSPTPKPGVVAFKDFAITAYPNTHSGGIGQACGTGDLSPDDHEEGRAFDWMVSASTQLGTANDMLNWLLATDAHGNPNAMARRLGIKYMIFNRRIWDSTQASRGWQAYSGTGNPHTDHVHFSFSWDGAYQRTSWWGKPRTDRDGNGYGDLVFLSKAPNGSGELWSYGSNQGADFWEVPTKHFGNSAFMADAKLAMGDVNGDRRADAVLARAQSEAVTEFYVLTGNADETFGAWGTPKAEFGVPVGSLQYALGDVDADGFADLVILARSPEGAASLWTYRGNKFGDFWEVPTKHFEGNADMVDAKLSVTDVNGDFHADVVLARPTTPTLTDFHVLTGGAGPVLGPIGAPKATFGAALSTMQIGAGDVNGDGFADLVLLSHAANGTAELWTYGGNKAADFWEQPTKNFTNSAFMAAAKLTVTDVNGDRRADAVLARPSSEAVTDVYVMTGNADRTLGAWGTAKATFGAPLATMRIG